MNKSKNNKKSLRVVVGNYHEDLADKPGQHFWEIFVRVTDGDKDLSDEYIQKVFVATQPRPSIQIQFNSTQPSIQIQIQIGHISVARKLFPKSDCGE